MGLRATTRTRSARHLASVFVLLGTLGCTQARDRQGAELAATASVSAAQQASSSQSVLAQIEERPPPAVGLDGQYHPIGVTRVDPGKPRIYAVAARAWIYSAPSKDATKLGYLRAGGSAPLLNDRAPGEAWVAVAPRGFIRVDSDVTFDAKHPVVVVLAERPADFERKLPYMYGTVRNPGPLYSGIPDAALLLEAEPDLQERMPKWLAAGGEIGAQFAEDVWTGPASPVDAATAWREQVSLGVPDFLATNQQLPGFGAASGSTPGVAGRMRPKTGYAVLETFLAAGRRYGITTSLKVAPTDRFRPIRGSEFHGFEIGSKVEFPFAIVRSPSAKFKDGTTAEYRSALPLSGKQQFVSGILFYETTDQRWISDRVASRVEPAKKMPKWGKQGEKWIDINITKQTLVLYEGETPVFATLVSSGEAGLESAESTTATKRGIFRIHTKHVTATMSSSEVGEEFELQDVPYVQYFDAEGHALHAAYWHDRFGVPKSHGCINLSPEDARRIFFWTEPRLPIGWHGVLSPLTGTVVFVHP